MPITFYGYLLYIFYDCSFIFYVVAFYVSQSYCYEYVNIQTLPDVNPVLWTLLILCLSYVSIKLLCFIYAQDIALEHFIMIKCWFSFFAQSVSCLVRALQLKTLFFGELWLRKFMVYFICLTIPES